MISAMDKPRKQMIERIPKSAFRGEAISLDTEEEIFYMPKSALYNNNMWMAAPSGPSGPSGSPVLPGERLVTWRPDMNRKENKTDGPVRQRYQPSTTARKGIVTWVPRIVTTSTTSVYNRQSLGQWNRDWNMENRGYRNWNKQRN